MELNNHTFDEITVGQQAVLKRTLTDKEVALFAAASGDVNPVHLDEEYASHTPFKQRIGHGMWLGGLISSMLGTEFPGPGTIYLSQNLQFKRPVFLDDEIEIVMTVTEKHAKKPIVTMECIVSNQHEEMVALGTAVVMAPTEKMSVNAPELPKVEVA